MIAVAWAVVALPSLSFPPSAAPSDQARERHQISAEERAAFTDARLAALKAGLKLTPAQEKNWPALEAALREQSNARTARAAAWRAKGEEPRDDRSVIEGLRQRATRLSARSAELATLADAAKPLFDSLDAAQKSRFEPLLHIGAEGRRHPRQGNQ